MSTNPIPSPNEAADGHDGPGNEPAAGGYRLLPHSVIDLGRQRRRSIRDLEHGYGELTRDLVAQAMQVCDELDPDEPGDIVPVVIIYRCVDDVRAEFGDGRDHGDLE